MLCVSGEGPHARECPTRQQRKSQRGSSGTKDCALIASFKPTTSHERDDSATGRVWEPSADQKRGLRNTDQREAWYTDSGASAHISLRREWFDDYHPRRDGSTVVLGDNRECAVVGEGNIRIERLTEGEWKQARIENVLYVPDMGKNLYSVVAATARNVNIKFEKDSVTFYRNGEAIACEVKQNNAVYRMFFRVIVPRHEEVNAAAVGMKTWHERLGHINVRALKDLTSKELVDGVKVKESKDFCENCQFGKSHKLLFKKAIESKTEPGEMVHSDVCGPMKETSLGGARFFCYLQGRCYGL